jgi:hypothetical protein
MSWQLAGGGWVHHDVALQKQPITLGIVPGIWKKRPFSAIQALNNLETMNILPPEDGPNCGGLDTQQSFDPPLPSLPLGDSHSPTHLQPT